MVPTKSVEGFRIAIVEHEGLGLKNTSQHHALTITIFNQLEIYPLFFRDEKTKPVWKALATEGFLRSDFHAPTGVCI